MTTTQCAAKCTTW